MAEEQDQERHLPASQKRLDDAREKGQIPRSRELTTAVMLLAAAATLITLGPAANRDVMELLGSGLHLSRASAFEPAVALRQAAETAVAGLLAFAPLFAVLVATALAAPIMVGGWVFSHEAYSPDPSRMNPLRGLANLVSGHALAELLKGIAKVTLVGAVAAWVLWSDQPQLAMLPSLDPKMAVAQSGSLMLHDFLVIASILVIVAAADVPLQIWRHNNQLKMSLEEVKREARESEGDPQLKGRIRQLQREAARRRMMSAVPKADVVVTNPTHYAVALSYQSASMRAPRIVAMGQDEVAARIRQIAQDNGVPLLEAPPLARALYRHGDLEQEIPAALYNAVAQVLAVVYQLKAGSDQLADSMLADLEVPPELDPMNAMNTRGAA